MADEMNDAKGMGQSQTPLCVVLLAYDGMNLLDLAGPLQALTTANRGRDSNAPARYETIVASGDGGAIVTGSGLPVLTVSVSSLADLAIDTLIAPGGCSGEEYDVTPALRDFIVMRAGSVRRLCSICTGAFLLAAAGQLDGRRVATHWAWLDRLKTRHPELDVDPNSIFVRDGGLWTSAGVSAAIDLTLALIEQDYGPRVAIDAARQMVVFMKRGASRSSAFPSQLRRAMLDLSNSTPGWRPILCMICRLSGSPNTGAWRRVPSPEPTPPRSAAPQPRQWN
jgi:transcriptional regulator GlxA family with amidase domain